jgi:hypothetical protein
MGDGMAREEWPGLNGRQGQAGGDGRWQPPEWRDAYDRNLPGNWQWGYAASQSQPQSYFNPDQPSQPGQRGLSSPPAQPPHPPPPSPQRGKSWPARHKGLTGLLALAGLIIIAVAANSGGSHPSPGGGTTVASTTTASAAATGAPGQHAAQVAAGAQRTRPGSTQPTSAASQAPAPPAPTPPTLAPTTPAPPTLAPTTPAPTTTAPTRPASMTPAPPRPAPTTPAPVVTQPNSAAPAGCQPLTNAGNCYEPGEFCRDSDHGVSGVAGDGEAITCEDNDGWHWEPS